MQNLRFAASVIVLLLGPACQPSATESAPRNLLLISIDTLAPSHMSLYGAERHTTPHLDALASRGVRFDNAFTPAPWTLPAHAALLTGRYPSRLSDADGEAHMTGDEPVLAQLFRRAGYSTGAFTGGGWISKSFRFQKGFDHFNAKRSNIDAGIGWLEEHRDEPWFLFFHTFSAHVPYTDGRFTAEHEGGRLTLLLDPESRGNLPEYAAAIKEVKCGEMSATRAEREYVEALYDGGVNRADDLVATWLEAIDRLGLAERTAVIVLSDHGEEFWEHTNRGSSHGHTLYDEVLRVPLIWVEPGAIAAGGVVTEPVSLIDVVPTIAVRFGLVPPAISDGVDLSPLLDGGSWSVDRPIFAESIRDGATRVSVRTKRGKLIAMTGPPKPRSDRALCDPPVLPDVELFLANDRSESDDRIGRADGLERELQALIATHLRQAKAALKDAPATVIDAETEEALRRLGYIE